MLAVGGPDAHAGRLHIYGYRRLSVFVEQSYLFHLTLIDDHAVLLETVLREMPDAVLAAHIETSGDDAALHVADQTFQFALVVEADGALHLVALFHSGNHECRMTAYLEMDFVFVGVVHVPYHVNLVAVQPVGDAQHEMIRIAAVRFGRVFQRKGHFRVSFVDEFEVQVAGKAVARHFVLISVQSVAVVPQSADYREQDGRAASPVFRVALP